MSFSPLGLTPLIGVFDMPRSLSFYRHTLGFNVISASPEVETAEGRFSHWMWLRFGSAEIMLNTQYDPNERPPTPPGKTPRDAVLYIGCSNVEQAQDELTKTGLEAKPPTIAPYGLKIFSVGDPDGYTIVFQEAPSQVVGLGKSQQRKFAGRLLSLEQAGPAAGVKCVQHNLCERWYPTMEQRMAWWML